MHDPTSDSEPESQLLTLDPHPESRPNDLTLDPNHDQVRLQLELDLTGAWSQGEVMAQSSVSDLILGLEWG